MSKTLVSPAPRQPYTLPTVADLGSVADLTQTGIVLHVSAQ